MIYFIGIIVSLFIEYLKSQNSLGGFKTLLTLVGVSLIAAGIYTGLQYAGWWDAVAQVLVTAGAFYAFIIQRFKE